MNPTDPSLFPPAVLHPRQVRPRDNPDRNLDLEQIINRVQRHKRVKNYFEQKRRGVIKCRFNCPFPNQPLTKLEKVNGYWEITLQRNGVRLNKFNAYLLQLWQANIDFQPIVSTENVLRYAAKFASKPVINTESFHNIMKNLCQNSASTTGSAKKVVQNIDQIRRRTRFFCPRRPTPTGQDAALSLLPNVREDVFKSKE